MSAWGGLDLDDDGANSPTTYADTSLDIDAILSKAETDPEAADNELQKVFTESAQNGNDNTLKEILGREDTAKRVQIDGRDNAGSTPLIYASCFGHERVVAELLRFGADPNLQDANEWTSLMWAVNNNHLGIVKQLLAAGADANLKTSTGRTMSDLALPGSATFLYLSSSGYTSLPSASKTPSNAFYEEAIDPTEMDNQFDHSLKESAVALGGFGATADIFDNIDDDDAESVADGKSVDAILAAPLRNVATDIVRDFDWDTFKVRDSFALPREFIPNFLDTVITNVVPTLRKNQAPMSANSLFLATRYFYYCGTTESFTAMTSPLARRIELVVKDESHSNDLAYLSYWLTNAEVFLYYLRKDKGLNEATKNDLQPTFENLIQMISQQIQTTAQNLLGPLIAPCLLDFDSIPEYGKVEYRGEWKLFRSSSTKEENLEDVTQKHMLPPTHEMRWKKPGPQRVTSILSSLLLLFQIYGVHSVTQAQIIAKLLYYMTSRMFNKMMNQRKYLNRRRAMQVRLNVSVIEDWCRNHNFRPESVDINGKTYRYKSLIDVGRSFLAPLNQLLAWLQTFSGFGSDFTNVVSTLQELKSLNPKQLLQTATHYRFETRESPLSKDYKHYLQDLSRHYDRSAEAAQDHQFKADEHNQKEQALESQAHTDLLDLHGTENTNTHTQISPSSRSSNVIDSCVLITYELPVANEYLLDENLPLKEHIPLYEEACQFWGDEDASGLLEAQGARFIIPFMPAETVEYISKLIEGEETESLTKLPVAHADDDSKDLEQPALASHKPIDGEERPDESSNIWAIQDDTGLAPVW